MHGRLPYDRIAADPHLARLLQSIPQRKVVSQPIDRSTDCSRSWNSRFDFNSD